MKFLKKNLRKVINLIVITKNIVLFIISELKSKSTGIFEMSKISETF